MSFQEARHFVLHAVAHAMYRDGSSGGIIRMLNVTKDQIQREYVDYKDVPVK
jgi:20S proteasome subunit beta 1